MCQEVKELVKGICKTCRRERKCHIDKCDWINKEVDAVRCWACTRAKVRHGAKNARLVMACPYHTSEEQRNSGLCGKCFDNRQQECEVCQEIKELVKGVCKTCRMERTCHVEECDWMNKEVGTARC